MSISVDKFARRLEQVERNVLNGATKPRLAHSSIDGGALSLKDEHGNTAGYVGQQFDGTITSAAVGGSWPTSPTTPLVTPVLGGIRIYWDGTYVDDSPTRMDFRRVTFHAVTDSDLFDPLDPAQIVGEVTVATGGEVTVSLPYVEHFVAAVAWTDAGKFSVPSDVAFGTPLYVSATDLDPDVGIGGDGEAPVIPPGWSVDLRPLGLMSLSVTWSAVENGGDPVLYDVYASQLPIGSIMDATYVGTTGGTGWSFGAIDDEPLMGEQDYYVAVVVRDTDGPSTTFATSGPMRVKRAGSGDVDPAWTYMGPISADQVVTGELSATLAIVGKLVTAGSGRLVSFSSADGFRAVDPSGESVMHIPTDLDSDISMQADLVAKSVTALGPVAMRSSDNEVAAGARVVLRSATAAPVTPPSVTIEWDTIDRGVEPGLEDVKSGAYHEATDRVYLSQSAWGASFVKWYNASTGAFLGQFQITNFGPTAGNLYSVSRYGDRLYCHIHLTTGEYVIRILNATTGAQIHQYGLGSITLFAAGRPATMVNSLGQLALVYSRGDGTTRQEVYDRNTGGLLEGKNLALSNLGAITAIFQGAADTGIYGTWIQAENQPGVILSCDAITGARTPGLDFPVAYGQRVAALWWDDVRGFASQSALTAAWHRYNGTVWFASESSVWHVTNTWRDTDAAGGLHETQQGPAFTLTMKKRAKLFVTTPPIPTDPDNANTNDPNAVSIYVGRGTGVHTTQWRQAMPAAGVRSALIGQVTFNNADTTHPNPPPFGDFPASTPALVTDATGDYYFNGDGDAKFKTLFVDGKDVGVTEGATLIGVSQWDSTNAELWRNGKMVTLRFDVTATSASSAGQPVANFPAGWAPPGRLYFFAMDGVSAAPVAMFVEATGNGLFHVGARTAGQQTVGSASWLLP